MTMQTETYPFLDSAIPVAFAHRGSSTNVRENSWAAFEGALQLGYKYLETDVRCTRDGIIVSCHDSNLKRVAGIADEIRNLTYAELTARLAGVGETELPQLADMLARWPHIRFNIDIKSWAAVEPTVQVIRQAGAIDRVCIASFSDFRTARARRLGGSRLCTTLGPAEVMSLKVASMVGAKPGIVCHLQTHAAVLQVSSDVLKLPLVDSRFVDFVHRLQLKLHVWTINDRPTMERLLDLGVDGIMTDEAELLKSVFVERDLWPVG